MQTDRKQERGLLVAQKLRQNLDLSEEDLGTMIGLTGAVIRAWQLRDIDLPDVILGRLNAAASSLERLLDIFLPDKLPEVIRRRAAAFDGERALEWILDGRIAEVAEKYEAGLAYMKRPA